MTLFRAVAYNRDHLRFTFFFRNPNWNGVQEAAHSKLHQEMDRDPLMVRLGPWTVHNIDVSA